jgi:hypothetical protein
MSPQENNVPSFAGNRSILEAALEGLEARRAKLDEQIAELRRAMAGAGESVEEAPAPRKRRMSAAGRKRIAEAARKRWAAVRAHNKGGAKQRIINAWPKKYT